jgi:hypothetical protein
MSAAYESVGYIQKTGKVSFGRTEYNYAEEKDIVESVRNALREQGVFIFQSQSDSQVNGNITTTYHECLFVCTDTGGWVKCRWQGTGQDSGDKGIYKAQTGANKYVLMKNLLIPTGDDPERYHEQQLRKEQERKKTGGDIDRQRKRFFALVSEVDADDGDAFRTYAKEAAKALTEVDSFNDIPLGHLQAACGKLAGADDKLSVVEGWASNAGMGPYDG